MTGGSFNKAIVKETDKDGNMKEVSAVLFGTPSNMEQAESWTAYTTEGTFGFQGSGSGRIS